MTYYRNNFIVFLFMFLGLTYIEKSVLTNIYIYILPSSVPGLQKKIKRSITDFFVFISRLDPACLEINRLERCYINQPLCPPIIPVLFTTPRGLFTGENTTNVHSISPSETRIHFSSMLPTTPIIDKYVFPPESSAAVDKLYIGSSDKSLKEWILPSAASSFLSPEKKASFPEKIEPPVQNSSLIQEYSSDKLTLNHLMTKLLSTQTSVSAHMQTASSTMPIQYWNDNKKDNETNITSDLNYSVSTNFLDVIYVILAVFGVILLYLCIRQTVKDLLHVTKRKNQRKGIKWYKICILLYLGKNISYIQLTPVFSISIHPFVSQTKMISKISGGVGFKAFSMVP